MKKFTRNMTIGEALKLNKRSEQVFMGFGMHCFSCAFSQMETLEEAAQVHDIDIDLLMEKLNELQQPKIQTAPIKIRKKKNNSK